MTIARKFFVILSKISSVRDYVNDKMEGRWVIRAPDGSVGEGPYVNGKREGQWVVREGGGCAFVVFENGREIDRGDCGLPRGGGGAIDEPTSM